MSSGYLEVFVDEYICVWTCTLCMCRCTDGQGPRSQKTTSDPLYLQLQMVVQRGCLDLNLGPLKEQGALLVTELSVCPASILKFEGLFL